MVFPGGRLDGRGIYQVVIVWFALLYYVCIMVHFILVPGGGVYNRRWKYIEEKLDNCDISKKN